MSGLCSLKFARIESFELRVVGSGLCAYDSCRLNMIDRKRELTLGRKNPDAFKLTNLLLLMTSS
jgi:hypothetical protein